MTTTTFYPSSSSPMTGGGVSTAVNVALLGSSASTVDGEDNAQASLYFDFSSIPSDATINTVKMEAKFGWADDAPASPIFAYGRTSAFGYMWGGGSIDPAGWDPDFAGALYEFLSYPSVPMTMAVLKNQVRVDFGGKGRFDWIRIVVDWTPATTPETPVTPATPKAGVTVSATRTSGSEVAAGGTATTAVVVSNSGSISASTVHVTTTADASVAARSWTRSDTGATGSGEIDVTISSLAAAASVTFYITDLIDSDSTGSTYSCAGSVSTTTDNEAGSPLAFATGSAIIAGGKQVNPIPDSSFDVYIDSVWPQVVDSYTIPTSTTNTNWDVNYARVKVSMDVMMSMSERNRWTFEMQVFITRDAETVTTTGYPTVTVGTAAGGRTSGGGHLEFEQLVACAPDEVIEVTVRCRMHGYHADPATTENHVYCSPCRIEIEPRN